MSRASPPADAHDDQAPFTNSRGQSGEIAVTGYDETADSTGLK